MQFEKEAPPQTAAAVRPVGRIGHTGTLRKPAAAGGSAGVKGRRRGACNRTHTEATRSVTIRCVRIARLAQNACSTAASAKARLGSRQRRAGGDTTSPRAPGSAVATWPASGGGMRRRLMLAGILVRRGASLMSACACCCAEHQQA
jgi:hypothetical protein